MNNDSKSASEAAHEALTNQGLTPRDSNRTEYVDQNGTLRAIADGDHTKTGQSWDKN